MQISMYSDFPVKSSQNLAVSNASAQKSFGITTQSYLSELKLKPLTQLSMPPPMVEPNMSRRRADLRSVPIRAHRLLSGHVSVQGKSEIEKTSKDIFYESLHQKGIQFTRINVTRRPGDFMYCHAAKTNIGGHCFGFVAHILSNKLTFKLDLNIDLIAKEAEHKQSKFESRDYFKRYDNDYDRAVERFYSDLGMNIGDKKIFTHINKFMSHLQDICAQKFVVTPVGQEAQVVYDIKLSGKMMQDHAVAVVIKKDASGLFHGAIIDANRGIRRTINQSSTDSFFNDFRKQVSGEATKSGHQRKLHTWQNAIITARQVCICDS